MDGVLSVIQVILFFAVPILLGLAITVTIRKNKKEMTIFWVMFAVTGVMLFGMLVYNMQHTNQRELIHSFFDQSETTTSTVTEVTTSAEESAKEEPTVQNVLTASFDNMEVTYCHEEYDTYVKDFAAILSFGEEYNIDDIGCRAMAVMFIMDKLDVTDYQLIIGATGLSLSSAIFFEDGEISYVTGLSSDIWQDMTNNAEYDRVVEEMQNILEQWAQTDEDVTTSTTTAISQESSPETQEPDNVPIEYLSALKKAESYSENLHMSKADIYDQLVSKYGGGFSEEAAQWAMEHLVADWYANALAKAESYNENLHMSKADLYDQLVSEYGGQFTPEEARLCRKPNTTTTSQSPWQKKSACSSAMKRASSFGNTSFPWKKRGTARRWL